MLPPCTEPCEQGTDDSDVPPAPQASVTGKDDTSASRTDKSESKVLRKARERRCSELEGLTLGCSDLRIFTESADFPVSVEGQVRVVR